MGFRTIAVGGLVPLKTPEILAVLEAVDAVRQAGTRLHLFGVTRCEHFEQFAQFGVVSFDSTSPLR
jgi:queuine/archaeosine tRNA-ribosyltransferase